jgi:hypothetical protein
MVHYMKNKKRHYNKVGIMVIDIKSVVVNLLLQENQAFVLPVK